MNRRDLQLLLREQVYPSISIAMRTHRTMPDALQDSIVLKNLVDDAKDRLKNDCDTETYKKICHKLDSIVSEIDFRRSLDSIVIFVNENTKHFFQLPIKVEESVVIDDSFEVRSILQALLRLPRYWVLELAEEPTRLYYGIGDSLSEIIEPAQNAHGEDVDGFPYDYIKPRLNHVHEKLEGNLQGDPHYIDGYREKFFERVRALLHRFTSEEPLPLVLVGIERNCVAFKGLIPGYPIIATVHGSYGHNRGELVHAVWPLVQEYLAGQAQEKISDFSDAIGRMQHAFGIDSVWRIAQEGRVHTLLLEQDFSVPGMVNPDNQNDLIIYDTNKKPGIDGDLVNLLIEVVIEKGGDVVFCPNDSLREYNHIAAILRY